MNGPYNQKTTLLYKKAMTFCPRFEFLNSCHFLIEGANHIVNDSGLDRFQEKGFSGTEGFPVFI